MPAVAFRFTTPVTDDTPHARLSDDELLQQLHVHRRETTEWAAAIVEVQRRADRLHSDERFRAALSLGAGRDAPPGRVAHSRSTAPLEPSLRRRRFDAVVNPNRQLVEVVVPVFDEEATLERNVEALLAYLRDEFPFRYSVVIADNASTDGTPAVAAGLASRHDNVSLLRVERKGRGLALRTAWLASDADVVSYMDVDLSTNLTSFLPLVAPLLSGHSEIAIGTRLAHGSHIRRRLEREVLSRGYNGLIHLGFRVGFTDAQCGFKALRADVARRLLPSSGTTAGSSTRSCCCSPSGTAAGSTRCRSTGSRTSTRACTSPPRSRATSPGSGGCGGRSGAATVAPATRPRS